MKYFILLFVAFLITACSQAIEEEVTIRGTKAYVVKESENSKEVLVHFERPSGDYVAYMIPNGGGPGYDVGDCDWCYIECIIFKDGNEPCMSDCDKSEACKGLVPGETHIVKSVSIDNMKLFNRVNP